MTGWICWKLSVKSKYLRMHPYSYLVYSSSLNVTRYSNTACALFSTSRFFFYLSRLLCLSLPLSLSLHVSHSQSLTDGWVRNHSNFVVAGELDWISLYVCAYVCHVCFGLMRSFCHIALWSHSSFSISLSHSLSHQLIMLSRVILYYSCSYFWSTAEPWSLSLERYVSSMIDLLECKLSID